MARSLQGALIVVLLCGLVYRVSAAEAAEDVCDMRGVDFSSLKDDCSMVSSSMRNGAGKAGACCSKVDALMVDVLEASKFDQMCMGEFFRQLATNGYPILALNYVDVCGGEDWRRALEIVPADPSLSQGPSRVPSELSQASQPVRPKTVPSSAPSSAQPSGAVTLVIPVLMQLAFAMAAIAFFLR